jgi:hypothetical protein
MFLFLTVLGCTQKQVYQQDLQKEQISQPNQRDIRPQPSPLSYGLVTSKVKKGITSQSELIRLFGGPNITTIDSDGTETWVYDKTDNESEILDSFFSLGYYGARQKKYSNTIKTITVIIKFNKDKTVKDFSARAAYF